MDLPFLKKNKLFFHNFYSRKTKLRTNLIQNTFFIFKVFVFMEYNITLGFLYIAIRLGF